MKLVTLFTVASILVASVQSFDELKDFIFKKYAMLKIYEDCYGKETVKGMFKEIKSAYSKCSGQTPKGPQVTLADFAAAYAAMSPGLMTMMSTNKKPQKQPQQQARPPMVPTNGGTFAYQLHQKPLPWVLPDYVDPAMQFYGYPPPQVYGNQEFPQYQQRSSHKHHHYEPFYSRIRPEVSMKYRQKRQVESTEKISDEMKQADAEMTAAMADDGKMDPIRQGMAQMVDGGFGVGLTLEKIQKMGKYMQARINNLTCIMKEIGFLAEDMKPDYESMRMRIEELPVADEVKADLCEGIDTCKEFSGCVPLKKYEKIPYLKDFAQPMVFFKCFQGKKLETCMKKDLREKFADMMDETMMTMARHSMTKSSIMADDDTGGVGENTIDSIFNMIYGFNMASSAVDDIF